MRSFRLLPVAASLFAALTGAAVAAGPVAHPKLKFPFNKIVAFGDNLSDNGNGSFAHGLTNKDNPNDKVYGYGTWTNGAVAVSYLATHLGIPLESDFAFGEAYGGSIPGATLSNNYTQAKFAPDGFQQVHNYTSNPRLTKAHVKRTLHFLWIGNNDITLGHIFPDRAENPAFASAMAKNMDKLVGNLVKAGAEHIVVPTIYPKHLAPFMKYVASNAQQRENIGKAIQQANEAIGKKLKKYGHKVLHYHAFGFMSHIFMNPQLYGIKYTEGHQCDGGAPGDWKRCVLQGHGDEYYWMQATDPTTRVHSLVAKDMAQSVKRHFLVGNAQPQ